MTGPCDSADGRAPLSACSSRCCVSDDVCITCSDQAVEVTVLEVRADRTARVDTGAGVEEVSVALVDAVPGDVVLVHAGEAIASLGRP